jgi:hypothetical protein
MKFVVIALALSPMFAYAGVETCDRAAWGHAQGQFETFVNDAVKYPRPENAKYLACVGQELKEVSARVVADGFPYYRYDFAVQCGPNTFTFWAEYYEKNGGCEWRGE